MSGLTNKVILNDNYPIENKILWIESTYMYFGISREISEFEQNTKTLNSEDRLRALNVLSELVKHYNNKYVISGKYLEDKFNELKEKIK